MMGVLPDPSCLTPLWSPISLFSPSWLWLQSFWSLIPNLLFCQPFPDCTLSFLSLLVPCCLACSNSRCSCLLLWPGFWSPPLFSSSIHYCCDPLCADHYPVLDNFYEQLSHCLQHCGTSTLSSIHHHASVPGWNIIIHLFKEKANFCYTLILHFNAMKNTWGWSSLLPNRV